MCVCSKKLKITLIEYSIQNYLRTVTMKQGNRQRACDKCKGTGQESMPGMVVGDRDCPCCTGIGPADIQGMNVWPCRNCGGTRKVTIRPGGICYNCYGSGTVNY